MNFWERLKLKMIAGDWEEYGHLKYSKIARKKMAAYIPGDFTALLSDRTGAPISFRHSGNSGDIIYALPVVKAISEMRGGGFFLQLDQKASYSSSFKHPLGNVMLNKKMADMLTPLLVAQDYIKTCEIYKGQHIDINLDEVRNAPIPLLRMSLSRWYSVVFGVGCDLHSAWLRAEPVADVSKSIVIARSNRYHGVGVDYSFLKKYPDVQFVGVEEEYNDMKSRIPGLRYRPVRDFLEMAGVIAGSKLFIGNQSFPFAIAEALKVNRLLEVSSVCPDVTVNDSKGREFSFQPHFEGMVERFMNNGTFEH